MMEDTDSKTMEGRTDIPFDEWFNTFREGITTSDRITDFNKVDNNTKQIEEYLSELDKVLGYRDFEKRFKELVNRKPGVLQAIPILLALRDDGKGIYYATDDQDVGKTLKFSLGEDSLDFNIDDYISFMKDSGLVDMFKNHKIKHVSDYVRGVEVGLDSNARKNRNGKRMEEIVEQCLRDAGFELFPNKKKSIQDIKSGIGIYLKQQNVTKLLKKYGDRFNGEIPSLKYTPPKNDKETRKDKETEIKVFDFVVIPKSSEKVYAIECNFYSVNGSKLNETARSYRGIYSQTSEVENFEFVWITDGKPGWESSKSELKNSYKMMEGHIFNLNDIKDGKCADIFV